PGSEKPPKERAEPEQRAVVLGTAKRKDGIGRVDGALVELGDGEVRVAVVPEGAAVGGAPDPAVVPDDQPSSRPCHGMLILVDATSRGFEQVASLRPPKAGAVELGLPEGDPPRVEDTGVGWVDA